MRTGQESTRPIVCGCYVVAFMQSDMNFLRSSAFMPFDLVLQVAILLSEDFFSADRHSDMNFLRSSPFLSVALALQVFMRSCCAFSAAKAGVASAAHAPSKVSARSFFISEVLSG